MMRYKKLYKQLAPLLEKGDFFVNLGANDGITNDPIYDFIEPFQLSGIAVEPIEATYWQLCENYLKYPCIVLERAAIYHREALPLYRLRDEILLKNSVLTQVATKDKQRLLKELESFKDGDLDPSVYEKINGSALEFSGSIDDLLIVDDSVIYMTFDELMAKHNVKKIDFLNMDIEGYDFFVFMAIDLSVWRPKIIVIETANFTDVERSEFMKKIDIAGYGFLQNFDYYSEVFVRL